MEATGVFRRPRSGRGCCRAPHAHSGSGIASTTSRSSASCLWITASAPSCVCRRGGRSVRYFLVALEFLHDTSRHSIDVRLSVASGAIAAGVVVAALFGISIAMCLVILTLSPAIMIVAWSALREPYRTVKRQRARKQPASLPASAFRARSRLPRLSCCSASVARDGIEPPTRGFSGSGHYIREHPKTHLTPRKRTRSSAVSSEISPDLTSAPASLPASLPASCVRRQRRRKL
jgi:hypothetical protein